MNRILEFCPDGSLLPCSLYGSHDCTNSHVNVGLYGSHDSTNSHVNVSQRSTLRATEARNDRSTGDKMETKESPNG
ncbi:hypothetical protein NL676_002176 [Syzygium grande]|nr:hypothetical protein NL676_002176 [Syzygium grande]